MQQLDMHQRVTSRAVQHINNAFCAQVNPLAETDDGKLIAADAKLGFDDNASFRHKDIFGMRDASQEDPRCSSR
jgi:succinyl-CoA synthetase beta subunit